MKLEKMTSEAWNKKTDAELRELIREGVKEINERRKSITSKTENDYIDTIAKIQGTTKTGNILATANKLSHKELVYRARKIDQFLDVDTSSKESFSNMKASNKQARHTYNERYDTNLTSSEYNEMVELMGAFKDQTQGFSSSQIGVFVEYAKDVDVSSDNLARIFGEAVKIKGVSESARMEWIFDRIDEMRG